MASFPRLIYVSGTIALPKVEAERIMPEGEQNNKQASHPGARFRGSPKYPFFRGFSPSIEHPRALHKGVGNLQSVVCIGLHGSLHSLLSHLEAEIVLGALYGKITAVISIMCGLFSNTKAATQNPSVWLWQVLLWKYGI